MTKTKYKNNLRDILVKFLPQAHGVDYGECLSMLQEKVEEQWPKENDRYFIISDNEIIGWANFKNDQYDKYRLKVNNVFRSESEAEARLKEVMEGK